LADERPHKVFTDIYLQVGMGDMKFNFPEHGGRGKQEGRLNKCLKPDLYLDPCKCSAPKLAHLQ